jgi:hypothetical protein
MKKISKLGRTSIMCASLMMSMLGLSTHSAALAGEQPNLLIVGEDADHDTVPRGSRIFNRVLAALTGDMQELGFKVYDETAVGMDITNPGRVRRTDAELISVAQRIPKPPIDAIAAFQIYASVQQNAYSDIKELRVRISGRLLQVQTGKALGNFEVAVGPRGLKPLPVKCNRDCILENVGDQAKPIAHEVGIVLARKLDELSPAKPDSASVVTAPAPTATADASPIAKSAPCSGMSTAYTIVVRGFDSEDTGRIERMLMSFKGYEHHRPVTSRTRYAEYWYETCSDEARLERNLRIMTEEFGGQARMAFSAHRFEIERIPGARKR